MDVITRGARWDTGITVNPSGLSTTASVTTILTGATVVATLRLFGTIVTPAPSAAVQDASARTVRLSYTSAETAQLAAADSYLLSLLVTASGGGDPYPVDIREFVRVR